MLGLSATRAPRVHINRAGQRIIVLALASIAALAVACSSGTPEAASILFTATSPATSDSIARGTDIYILRADDEEPTRLTTAGNDDFSPKWSPNRSQIAFVSQSNVGYDLWVTNATGSDKRQLFSGLGSAARFEWSPDSMHIAYEVQKDGGRQQIIIGNVATGDKTVLTSESESAHLGSWSPDGEWLVYTLVSLERSGIYKVNPDGVNEIEVSSTVGKDPRWSPNGRWIVFIPDIDGHQNLVVVASGGGDETNLTPNAGNNGAPSWSPDGDRIAFVSDRDGNPEIYVIDFNGRNERRLTQNRSEDVAPSWSRRTNRIAFASNVDGDFDLFTMRPDGSNQRRLTSDNRNVLDLDW